MMSEYWSLRCNTCNVESDDDINHGDQVLLDIIAMAPDLAAVYRKDTQGYIEMSVLGHGDTSTTFAAQHAGHDMVVLSEYGRTKEPPPAI